MPGGWQQRGGSPVQTLLREQRWPHPPQLLISFDVSTQVPPGLAPQQLMLGNVHAAPDPQRQVWPAQVFAFPVQLRLAQQLPPTQSPSQQTP